MMARVRGALLPIAIAAVATMAAPAGARPPGYANKSNVERAAAETETVGCWNDAMAAMKDPKLKLPYVRNAATENSVAGAAGAGLARGMAQGLEDGKRFKLTYYDCMISKGYTLRRPTEADWKAYKKLDKTARQARMFEWVSAAVPVHPEAPREEFD